MSAEDVARAENRIREAEARLDALRDRGIETKSLRSCLGLARSWVTDGSPTHAEAICDEVMGVASQLDGTLPTDAGAVEISPVGSRLLDLEQRLRDHFSRELGQTMAAKPWNIERKNEERGHGSGVRDVLEQVRGQVEELRRLMQEGGAAGVSLEEVKSVISGELEANGLASKLNRQATRSGVEPPVPPFVERLDARLMQIANAQERVTDRLSALERSLTRLVEQSIHDRLPPDSGQKPAMVAEAKRDFTGSWLQDLDAAVAPIGAPEISVETISANAASDDIEPSESAMTGKAEAVEVADAAADPTEAATLMVGRPAGTASFSASAPGTGTGPLQRVDDEQLRAVIALEMAKHQPDTVRSNLSQPTPEQGDAEFARRLAKALPEVLRLPAVHESVLALVAVEAATHPGALAELSGVRAFLRRELLRQVDEIKKALVIGEPV